MKNVLFALSFCLLLIACDTAEERAERHFQTAVTYIEDGDSLRGLIELRNVFRLNGRHREARRLYAETVLRLGRGQEAYSQFLRLVEQYPSDLEANRQLAKLSVQSGLIVEARRFLDVVLEAEPDNAEAQSLDALIIYEASGNSDRVDVRNAALQRSKELLAQDPTLNFARQVVLSHLLRARDWSELVKEVDRSLEYDSGNMNAFRLRLLALERLGDTDEIEETLVTMTRRFPDDPTVGDMLVRWYIGANRLADAEAWLRRQIKEGSSDPQPRLTLIDFLSNFIGQEEALTELTRIEGMSPRPLDVAENYGLFAALRAGLMFEMGSQRGAILRLEGLIKDTDVDAEEINRMKVALARMYEASGRAQDARALVGDVLTQDSSQVGALMMRGAWEIEEDNTAEAIATLREALDKAPRDADVLTLLARAYEREGSRELLLEMLVRAVEAANRAPKESQQLALALTQDGQFRSAEAVLIEALQLSPFNVPLLLQLGELHIELADWGRVAQDIGRLRDLTTREANAAADKLEAEQLIRQSKTDDLMRFVEGRAAGDETGEAGVIRALVLTGRTEEALQRAATFYEARPEDPIARFVYASVLTYVERDAQALPIFEGLVAEDPAMTGAWSSIYSIHHRAGNMEAAVEALDRAESTQPKDVNLRWIRAGHFEGVGETETAIAIYEDVYAINSNLPVIANNLASLLSTTRDDPESLERAYIVSRRLRDTEVPAFADTYGWIAYRRNELYEALTHLELAAAGLPNEASVQYHLGQTYVALERFEDARVKLARAKLLIDEGGRAYPGLGDLVAQSLASLPEPAAPDDVQN